MEGLDGKVGFVTGAGSGIGRAIARRLASEGAGVMCADIDETAAAETAAMLADSGASAASIGLDVRSGDDVRSALEKTMGELGGLHGVVNNAGVGGDRTWSDTLDVNLTGVYWGLTHGSELLARNGGGSIVNTASILGLVGLSMRPVSPDAPAPHGSGYIAAKHGVVGLTQQFALAYASLGVRVNAVAPGFIDTPMTEGVTATDEMRRSVEALHPLGRLGRADEIAAAVTFLLSDDASFITGVTLPVDGGYTAQ